MCAKAMAVAAEAAEAASKASWEAIDAVMDAALEARERRVLDAVSICHLYVISVWRHFGAVARQRESTANSTCNGNKLTMLCARGS